MAIFELLHADSANLVCFRGSCRSVWALLVVSKPQYTVSQFLEAPNGFACCLPRFPLNQPRGAEYGGSGELFPFYCKLEGFGESIFLLDGQGKGYGKPADMWSLGGSPPVLVRGFARGQNRPHGRIAPLPSYEPYMWVLAGEEPTWNHS